MATESLDDKFNEVFNDPNIDSMFNQAGMFDSGARLGVMRRLFLRSGYDVDDMVKALKSLKQNQTTFYTEFLYKRLEYILSDESQDANTSNTIAFIKKTSGDDGAFTEFISNHMSTVPELPTPSTGVDTDIKNAIIDACINYSKTCMLFTKSGFDTREKIKDELLRNYLK